jgi:hypothetical protein
MPDQESRFVARNSSLKLANNRDTQHHAKIAFHGDSPGHAARTPDRLNTTFPSLMLP